MSIAKNDIVTIAWNKVIEAEGTRVVFNERARKLQRLVRTRDMAAFSVPILVAAVFGLPALNDYEQIRPVLLIALSLTGTAQLLMSLRSLIANWDADLAYAIRSARDAYLIKEQWRRIAQGDTPDLDVTFRLTQERQMVLDASDAEKGITAKEERYGMRNGLFELQRACLSCKEIPNTRRLPLIPQRSCSVCGGNSGSSKYSPSA